MLVISKLQNIFYLAWVKCLETVAIVWDFLFIKIYLAILLVLNLAVWVLAILFARQLTQNLIILHFNVDSGVDLIGEARQVFLMPLLATATILLNILLVLVFWKNPNFKFCAHILLLAAILVNIFILMSFGPLYYINFR